VKFPVVVSISETLTTTLSTSELFGYAHISWHLFITVQNFCRQPYIKKIENVRVSLFLISVSLIKYRGSYKWQHNIKMSHKEEVTRTEAAAGCHKRSAGLTAAVSQS
jgi:hypothetical protein